MLGYIWPMFFSLFITPIIIFHLGIKNYGIYLFINAIISLFGLLDLGLGTAIIKHMSYYYGKKDSRSISTLTHSANSLFIIIGCTGFIISLIIAFYGPLLLPTQFAVYRQYSLLFILGGAIFFVSASTNTYVSILTALQRFDIANKIGIISITASSLIILVAVISGAGIQGIFIIQFIIGIFFAVITIYQAKKILPEATLQLGWDNFEIKHCYQFGLITFVNNIATTALASLDRLIIPFYLGPSNLTYYSLPGNVTGKIPGISNTLSSTMFPTTSQMQGEQNSAQIEIFYIRSFRLITIMAAALSVTCIAFSYKILLYWLNADFANHSSIILIILTFTNFILAMFGPLSNFLLGLGKLKFLTTMSTIMGILNVILLIIFLPRYGITGAAWAYLISVLPVGYVFYYTEKKYLSLTNRKHYYIKKLFGITITSIIVLLTDTYLCSPLVVNIATLLLMGGVSVLLFLLTYKFLNFIEREDWKDIEQFYLTVRKKILRI